MAMLNAQDISKRINGSSIDIDVIIKNEDLQLSHFAELIEKAHIKEKQIFFGLLAENFLKELNPEY